MPQKGRMADSGTRFVSLLARTAAADGCVYQAIK